MRLPTITGPTSAVTAARLNAESAVLIHATLATVLERVAAAAGTGYPSTASGADAGGRGSGPVASSTERHALNGSHGADQAHTDLQRLYSGLHDLAALSHELGRICGRWFEGQLTADEIIAITRNAGGKIWCANPAHVTPEPRAAGRNHCAMCGAVLRDTGVLPDRALLDIRGRRNVVQRDLDAFRARHRQTKVAKKGKGKVAA